MLAWENINHQHYRPFLPTMHPFRLNVGDWNAFSPADPLSLCQQCQAFQLSDGAWGDGAGGLCKAPQGRQTLWLQVTPETTHGISGGTWKGEEGFSPRLGDVRWRSEGWRGPQLRQELTDLLALPTEPSVWKPKRNQIAMVGCDPASV